MKRVIIACVVVATVAYATSAWSSAGANPTQKQIAALQTQVKTLKKQVTEAQAVAVEGLVVSLCGAAITADELQGTWTALDQFSATTSGHPLIGPQTTVTGTVGGQDVCAPLRVTRSRGATPPSLAPFQSIFAGAAARYAPRLHR